MGYKEDLDCILRTILKLHSIRFKPFAQTYLVRFLNCLTGSIAGIEELGAPIPYSSSKSALLSYAKSLSFRLAKKKIRVNIVSPGNIHFPNGNWDKKLKANPDEIKKMLSEKVPLQKFGKPSDIGDIVAFLLSPRAGFITGANLVVDGGQTVGLK